ncbi:malectin domain-containing carbohydrate-binding protein [Halocatena pleomorpha]|uniref:malectin domain-containing carbohydrate-binding protein n=1 Tax=Halocatena pleomorpha TaxID=1785090 RepID=UPI00163B1399|nr:malectin domain-containing carbohydrate-binding protein [Halocatena pleomorpha]
MGSGIPLGGVLNSTSTPSTETPQTTVTPTPTATPTPTPTTTPTATPTTTPTPTERVEYRVNVGGQRLDAPDGPDWIADSANSPATYLNHEASETTVSNTTDPITVEDNVSESVPQKMFKTNRFEQGSGLFNPSEEMTWTFPVDPDREYEVRIYVMEEYLTDGEPQQSDEAAYTEAGPRSFDVSIENETVLRGYNPFLEHGHDVGGVNAFQTTSEDGTLTIQFHRGEENPIVSGIEIVDKGPRDSGVTDTTTTNR